MSTQIDGVSWVVLRCKRGWGRFQLALCTISSVGLPSIPIHDGSGDLMKCRDFVVERQVSAAAGSWSVAAAVGSQLQTLVRRRVEHQAGATRFCTDGQEVS